MASLEFCFVLDVSIIHWNRVPERDPDHKGTQFLRLLPARENFSEEKRKKHTPYIQEFRTTFFSTK
jgi:hypothetical protein